MQARMRARVSLYFCTYEHMYAMCDFCNIGMNDEEDEVLA